MICELQTIEQSEVLKALVELKNRLISENRYTDAVDDAIIKISKAKKKHMKAQYI